MAEAANSLRERVAESGLTVGRVVGSHVFEIGHGVDFIDAPLRVIRAADLLVLEFRFVNLHRQGARLVKSDPAKSAFLIAIHQPQSFGEQVYPEISDQSGEPGDENGFANDPKLDGMELAESGPRGRGAPFRSLICGHSDRPAEPGRLHDARGIDRIDRIWKASRACRTGRRRSTHARPAPFRIRRSHFGWLTPDLRRSRCCRVPRSKPRFARGAARARLSRGPAGETQSPRLPGPGNDAARCAPCRCGIGARSPRARDDARESIRSCGVYVRAQASRHSWSGPSRARPEPADPKAGFRGYFIGASRRTRRQTRTAIEMPYRRRLAARRRRGRHACTRDSQGPD